MHTCGEDLRVRRQKEEIFEATPVSSGRGGSRRSRGSSQISRSRLGVEVVVHIVVVADLGVPIFGVGDELGVPRHRT